MKQIIYLLLLLITNSLSYGQGHLVCTANPSPQVIKPHIPEYIQKKGKNWKVFKFKDIIGANSGKETCYIRVECSTNTIHGHPILENDYLECLK